MRLMLVIGATILGGTLMPHSGWGQTSSLPVANVKSFNAAGDGNADDTAAIQTAINSLQPTGGTVYFPCGYYKLTGVTFPLPFYTVEGATRDCVVLINSTPAFTMLYKSSFGSANYEQAQSFVFQNFTLNAQNGIKLNQTLADLNGNAALLDSQGILIGPIFSNLTLTGTYSPYADVNYDSAAIPGLAELTGYGIGISLSKVFDSVVQTSILQQHGIEELVEYGDDNHIEDNRVVNGGRLVHMLGGTLPSSFYGSTLQVRGNEVLAFHRPGWVYLEATNGVSIENNSWEGRGAAGTFIQTKDDQETRIQNNDFTFNFNAAIQLNLNPYFGLIYAGNVGPASVAMGHDYWISSNPTYGSFINNGPDFPTPNFPGVALTSPMNPLLFSANNCLSIGGAVSSSFPWVLSPATKRFVLGPGYLVSNFFPTSSSPSYTLRIVARQIANGGVMNTAVTYTEGGKTQVIFSGSLMFASSTMAIPVDAQIVLPAGVSGSGYLQILEDGSQEVESIQFVPAP